MTADVEARAKDHKAEHPEMSLEKARL